jgi:hypothetical protein
MSNPTPKPAPFNCPYAVLRSLRLDVRRVKTLSAEMRRALRKLQRDLRLCQSCELLEACPARQLFHQQVEQALAEFWEEIHPT